MENFLKIVSSGRPNAVAVVKGSNGLLGKVRFFETREWVAVEASFVGLPENKFLGFHIHEKGECDSNFSSAGGHYGTGEHPFHAGDMPPLFSTKSGVAFSVFLTSRFSISEILGKAVIVHNMADDFTSQPAGSSGERIGCGVIFRTYF